MGKKSPPPKPPDLKPISDAQLQIARESTELAREQLGLSRQQFAYFQQNAAEELALAREQADRVFALQQRAFDSDEQTRAMAERVGEAQIGAMEQNMDYARRDRERYESVFLPMQDRMVSEANEYDTPERREAEASRQMVDVQRQVEAQRTNADARLRSMGVDPSQVRSTSMMNQMAVAGAANQAMAGNAGRTMIEDKGRALRADAINMGMGLPSQVAASYGAAGAAGAGAMGAAGMGQGATLSALGAGANMAGQGLGFRGNALGQSAALTGSPMQWAQAGNNSMGMASNNYNSAANTINQGYQNQMTQWNAQQQQAQQGFSNAMSIVSMGAGMMIAEGGEVKRKNFSEGGDSMDEARGMSGVMGRSSATEKTSILDKVKERFKKNDQYIRPAEGKKLSMDDRMSNAVTAGNQWSKNSSALNAGNSYENAPQQQFVAPVQHQMDNNYAEGGSALGSRVIPVKQARDKINATLTEGEYVVPADVVRALGVLHFDKLVQKHHRSNA